MTKGHLLGVGRTADVYAWGEDQIVKLYRSEFPTDWVHFEARIGRIVAEAGLSAPTIGDVVEVDGRLGILYERIDGPSMLDTAVRQPWMLFRLARQFAGVHVAMHNCIRRELPSQREALIRAIGQAPRLTSETRTRVLQALNRLPDGESVCHGDYHPDNVLMTAKRPIVIDWMTTTRGNPVADVARTTLLFRTGSLPPGISAVKRTMSELFRKGFYAAYLREYLRLRPFSDEQIETWIPVMAAARLNERLPQEENRLVALAETAA